MQSNSSPKNCHVTQSHLVLEAHKPRYILARSYKTSTNAPPTLRTMLATKPLYNPLAMPSSDAIFLKQSMVPLYKCSSGGFSDCICKRRRTVSKGYVAPAPKVIAVCAAANVLTAPIIPLSVFQGLRPVMVSKVPSCRPRYPTIPTTDTPKPV